MKGLFCKYMCISLALLLSLLLGCEKIDSVSTTTNQGNYPITIMNEKIMQTPTKVVSLSPSITEVIYELGFESSLIGRSKYCDFPDISKEITDVGSGANPSIESIIDTGCSLVLTQSAMSKSSILELNRNRIRVITLPSPQSIDEMFVYYQQINCIFMGNNAPQEEIEARLDFLEEVDEEAKSAKTAVIILSPTLAVATGDSLAGELLSKVCVNVANEAYCFEFSVEEIVKSNPDYIFLGKDVSVELLPEEIQGLDSVKSGRIKQVSTNLAERPSSRIDILLEEITEFIE